MDDGGEMGESTPSREVSNPGCKRFSDVNHGKKDVLLLEIVLGLASKVSEDRLQFSE